MRVFRTCACYIFLERFFLLFYFWYTLLEDWPNKRMHDFTCESKKANCKICTEKSGADQYFGCFTVVAVSVLRLPLEKDVFSVSFVLWKILKVFKGIYIIIQYIMDCGISNFNLCFKNEIIITALLHFYFKYRDSI